MKFLVFFFNLFILLLFGVNVDRFFCVLLATHTWIEMMISFSRGWKNLQPFKLLWDFKHFLVLDFSNIKEKSRKTKFFLFSYRWERLMWFAFVLPINCQPCALRSVGRKSVMSRLTNKDFLESKCVKGWNCHRHYLCFLLPTSWN